ncbi:MAG: metallophosphoesterase [Bacteroidia bacterium]
MLIRSLIFVLILFVVDLYVFQAVRVAFRSSTFLLPKNIYTIYWILCASCYLILIAGGIIDWHTWPKAVRTYLFAFVFISFFAKLFVVIFLLVDDLIRLFRWLFKVVFQSNTTTTATAAKVGISRSDFLVRLGLIIGAVPFFSMIYGMFSGAYNYSVKRIKIKVPDLPDSFNGFKIVQLSDIHTGSFTRKHPVHRSVDLAMEEKPDIIFFTGDLVNDKSEEALPYMEVFNKLNAPHGVYSIFGNHDYGDYIEWESPAAKIANLEKLKQIHKQLGWKLMLDENARIQKGDDHIGLLGVQNWSTHLRFPKYGSMEKATKDFEPSSFNILLSHDPSHWRAEILEKYPFVDLMLAGHTHGFQFGIEIPGFKWSPVQYIYNEWAGLYKEGRQHLYVNRGLGFLGYPGRVGIMPEITVIELVKA